MEYPKANKEEAEAVVKDVEAVVEVIRTWKPQNPELELTPVAAKQVVDLADIDWNKASGDMKSIRTVPDGTTDDYPVYPALIRVSLAELQFLGSVSINHPDAHLDEKVEELFPHIYLHIRSDGSTPADLEEARRRVLDQAEYTLELAKRSLAKLE